MKKQMLIALISTMIILSACGIEKKPKNLQEYTSGANNDYTYITIDKKVFVPFGAVDNTDRGDWIGIVDGDENNRIYDYKGYSPDEWVISFYNSGEMDSSMLMKEQNITEYPDGLTSEYHWNNTENEIPKGYTSIDKYFTNSHEHESMDGNYTKTVDLNGDGENETITIEPLMHNGGDGGYFPHVYNSDGDELVYQQDSEGSSFKIKWVDGNAIIFYDGQQISSLSKDYIFVIYKEKLDDMDLTISDEELTNTILRNEEMCSDAASGFVVTADNELIVKYYIEGKYGHVDCLGYGLLHLKLNKDETWDIEPEFVLDSE